MRIICDHCNQDINGTVKRVAGNFNLHPQCAAQLGHAQQESTALLCLRQESLYIPGPVWKGAVPSFMFDRVGDKRQSS